MDKAPYGKVTSLTDSDLQRYSEDAVLSDLPEPLKSANEENKVNRFPSIDPSDLAIEDLDPYSEQHRIYRSRSYTLPPSSTPPSAFKLPRSKSVHFEDQGRGSRSFINRVSDEEKSLLYSDSTTEFHKEKTRERVQECLTGLFATEIGSSFAKTVNKDAQCPKSVSVTPESDIENKVLFEGNPDGELSDTSPDQHPTEDKNFNSREEAGEVEGWNQINYEGEDEPGKETFKKLSELYDKYFSGLAHGCDNISELIGCLDSGISDSLQQTKFCQSLLDTEQKRSAQVEKDMERWKKQFSDINMKYEELDKIYSERQDRLENEIGHISDNTSREIETLKRVNGDLELRIKKEAEAHERQASENKKLTEQNKLLLKEKESFSLKYSETLKENKSLKMEIKNIEATSTTKHLALEKKIDELRDKLDSVTSDNKVLVFSKQQLESKLERHIVRIESLGTSDKEMKAVIVLKDSKIREQLECNQALRKSLEDYKKVTSELTEEIQKMSGSMEAKNLESSQSKAEIKKLCFERDSILQSLENLRGKIADGSKELEEAESRNSEALKQLQALCEKQQQEASRFTEELEQKNHEMKELGKEMVEKDAKLNELEQEVKKRKAKFQTCFNGFQTAKWSNTFAVETMRKLLKSTYESLVPLIPRETASENAQLYYEVSRIDVFTKENQSVLTRLTTALIESNRQVMRAYADLSEALSKERRARDMSQKESMTVIRKLARANRNMKQGPRRWVDAAVKLDKSAVSAEEKSI